MKLANTPPPSLAATDSTTRAKEKKTKKVFSSLESAVVQHVSPPSTVGSAAATTIVYSSSWSAGGCEMLAHSVRTQEVADIMLLKAASDGNNLAHAFPASTTNFPCTIVAEI